MASKRNASADPAVSAGAAPARAKAKVTRKHTIAAPPETPENAAPAASAQTNPAVDEIAQLAYSYWEARGYQGGSPEEDWLRAERELVR